MRARLTATLIVLIGCRAPETEAQQRLSVLEHEVQQLNVGVATSSGNVYAFVQTSDALAAKVRGTAAEFNSAAMIQSEARKYFDDSSAVSEDAGHTAVDSANLWGVLKYVIVLAAAVDAVNLDAATASASAGSTDLSCADGMSTARYRALHSGKVPLNSDVDHIVPRSLGGADHPLNYQWLGASENRSLGNYWGPTKCLAVGKVRCALAIAISVKCGSFKLRGT